MKASFFKTSVLLVSLFLIVFSSCKKTEEDDPTITYKSLNKTINVVAGGAVNLDSIDLNGDGVYEMVTEFTNKGADTGTTALGSRGQSFQILIESLTPAPYSKVFAKDENTPTSNLLYNSGAYTSVKTNGYRLGLLNGEGYFVFRFSTGTKFQYGWMKLSINSAFTEFKIIEYAYSTQYDTPIKVGAK